MPLQTLTKPVDREKWLIQLINGLPNNEDWQRRIERFNDINMVTFKTLYNLENYCAEHGLTVTQLADSQTLSLPKPKTSKPLFQSNQSGAFTQPKVQCAIVNHIVSGPSSFAYHTDNDIIRTEYAYQNRDDFILNNADEHAVIYLPETRSNTNKAIVKKIAPNRRVSGLCLSLLSPNSRNYYHFLYEQMPKVLLLNELTLNEPITLLVPQNIPPQFKQVFDFYQLKHPIEYIEQEEFIEMERALIVTGLGNVVCDINPDKNPTLNDNCISNIALNLLTEGLPLANQSKQNKKLYIARKLGSGGRSDLNEEAVMELAKELGFTVYSPEQHSFAEQVATFQNADVVFGFSGAGFTNMIFAKPSTKAIVICAYEGNKTDYAIWSKPAYFKGINLSIFCTNHVGANHIYKSFCDKSVDVEELAQFVKTVISKN